MKSTQALLWFVVLASIVPIMAGALALESGSDAKTVQVSEITSSPVAPSWDEWACVLYEHRDFNQNRRGVHLGMAAGNMVFYVGDAFNDKASSAFVNVGCTLSVFIDRDYLGDRWDITYGPSATMRIGYLGGFKLRSTWRARAGACQRAIVIPRKASRGKAVTPSCENEWPSASLGGLPD
jgi:hypothetical protein